MPDQIASFYASIGADSSGLQKELEKTKASMTGLQSSTNALQGIVTGAFVAMGAAAVAFAASIATTGIQFDALKEQATVAFTTMLNSGQAAQAMLDELQAFAQKTPFEFPDLIRASQRLMAMGFAAVDVIPTLTAIGDAVAAMGGSAEMVDRVTVAIGQMNAKGKASGEEMRQLTEAGIPVWQMLADKIGVTVPQAMDMVSGKSKETANASGLAWKAMSDGVIEVLPKMRSVASGIEASGVSAATAIAAITDGIESRYGGMMNAQSKTWNGIISNIKDGFTQMSGTIMQPFFDMAKEQLGKVAIAIGDMSRMLQNGESIVDAFATAVGDILPPEMLDAWIQFNGFIEGAYQIIKAIIVPISSLISKFVTWQDVLIGFGLLLSATILPVIGSVIVALVQFLAPIAGVILAVTALRMAYEHNFLGIKDITNNAFKAITKFFEDTHIWKGTWNETFYGFNGIKFTLTAWINWARTEISQWVQWGIAKFEFWKNEIIGTFTHWKDVMLQHYHEFADPILRDLTHWAEGIKQKFDWMISWIIGDFGYWTKFVNFLKEKWKAFTDWWDINIQPFIDSGAEMMQGLWDGVRKKWDEFYRWWQGVWTGSVKWVKDLLGIKSPSKVFADIGENMMMGLAGGISDSANAVTDAISSVAQAATDTWIAATKYDPGTSLADALGMGKAAQFKQNLANFSNDAKKALQLGNVAAGNPAYDVANSLIGIGGADSPLQSISDIMSAIDQLTSDMNNLGVGSTFGQNARNKLYGMSKFLEELTYSGGTSTTPPSYPSTPTSPMPVSSSGDSTSAILQVLQNILAELHKNGSIDESGFRSVANALGRGASDGGYGTLVGTTAGLR